MIEIAKDKTHLGVHRPDEKKRKITPSGICEICSQEMERDPESGEYFCPDCDYADDKA